MMKDDILEGRDFENEFVFSASRSSGPGGQNVNKVNSRIELRFNIRSSDLLNESEKDLLCQKLASKITGDGYLLITSQASRSQIENRQKSIEKFYIMLRRALMPVKKRIRTKPGIAAKRKRLETKKINSRKKELRRTLMNDMN